MLKKKIKQFFFVEGGGDKYDVNKYLRLFLLNMVHFKLKKKIQDEIKLNIFLVMGGIFFNDSFNHTKFLNN